jgi:hypothetical protein
MIAYYGQPPYAKQLMDARGLTSEEDLAAIMTAMYHKPHLKPWVKPVLGTIFAFMLLVWIVMWL